MGILSQAVKLLFVVYTILLMVRILGSWFPSFSNSKYMRFVVYYTDPYLNIFRKIIPPIGNVDLSPMVAFFALSFLKNFILRFLG